MIWARVRMIINLQRVPRRESQGSEASGSIGQAKEGTFQSLTTGLGTGNGDHLTVGADEDCRNHQGPHPGLGTAALAAGRTQKPGSLTEPELEGWEEASRCALPAVSLMQWLSENTNEPLSISLHWLGAIFHNEKE